MIINRKGVFTMFNITGEFVTVFQLEIIQQEQDSDNEATSVFGNINGGST